MEESNKYYTPSIEEFHIGFEYEILEKDNTTWTKIKSEGFMQMSILFFRNGIKTKVKYLNKEDIESCGWKYVKTHPGITESFFEMTKEDPIDSLGLDYDSESHYLRIYDTQFGQDNTFFSGEIKNKSELVKLMKQLNIN